MDGPTQDSLHWFNIIFPAIMGLLGVLLGGLITSQNAKNERVNRRHREQLDFYGAMHGMQQNIRAKSETRLKLRDIERRQRDTSGLEAQMKMTMNSSLRSWFLCIERCWICGPRTSRSQNRLRKRFIQFLLNM